MYKELIEVYDYGTKHEVGQELTLKKSISLNYKKEDDYKELLKRYSKESLLERILEGAKRDETLVVEKLKEAMSEWVDFAGHTKVLMDALELKKSNELANTVGHSKEMQCNVWTVENGWGDTKHIIKNQTYQMSIRAYPRTQYNRDTKEQDIIAYEVSYYLSTNSPLCKNYSYQHHNNTIKSIDRKLIKDKERMLKYIDGRKGAFAHYFKEDRPPILRGYEHVFKVNGVLLDGYSVVDELSKE